MLEIGWTEMLVIAVVMIVVVGPKDLPKMLRTFGRFTAKARSMAGDFQRQFNEALKEAELDDVKTSINELRSLNPANEIRKQLNPFEKAAADVRAGVDSALKPTPSPAAAAPAATEGDAAVAQPAEPLKAGAPAVPVSGTVSGPATMPAPVSLVAETPVKADAKPEAVATVVTPEAAPRKPRAARAAAATAAPKPAASTTKAAPKTKKPAAAASAEPAAAKPRAPRRKPAGTAQ